MRSRILAGMMAIVVATGFVMTQGSLVLAQNAPAPAESKSETPSIATEGQDNGERVMEYRQQNDVLYYGDEECVDSPAAAPAQSAGSDCKGEPLPESVPEYWRNLINKAAEKYPDTDRRLVAATLWIENRGWPDPNKQWATSSASAKGPWQFIPSSWASMGEDCNNDGKKDVNDPEDAVCAAFVHLKGSACKPILEGATGDADHDYANVPFKRDGNNTLMSAIANYNGSGTRDGVPLAKQGRGQNPDYVRMAYWLIVSGFTETVDIDKGTDQRKKIDQTNADSGTSSVPNPTDAAAGGECPDSSGGAAGAVVQIDGFNYSFPLALAKDDVVHAGDEWPCRGGGACHHDGTPAFDLFKKGRGEPTENTPVLAITDGEITRLSTRNNDDACKDWTLVGKDGWQYWYGHNTAPSVQNGAQVTAGQEIGKVGKRHCADKTDPHLHIDRGSPKGRGGGSVCCRDEGFVPLLNEIHARMPGGASPL